ncbi:methyltransferase family protein [Alicyclobacillus acidiphilus]|uniref:methyltransferase family protein n=2 Tax=Alicyclobacillus acidiphilus TaxID=182455 RepID=UPI0035DAF7A1
MSLWKRARLLRRGQPKKQNDDRGSAVLIILGMYVLIFISIAFSIRHLGILPRWTQYIGYVLMIAGMIIRFTAIIQLGRFFSPVVGVVSNQEIVQSGLYRSIRHPAYTGGWITAVGIAFGLRTWWEFCYVVSAYCSSMRTEFELRRRSWLGILGEICGVSEADEEDVSWSMVTK